MPIASRRSADRIRSAFKSLIPEVLRRTVAAAGGQVQNAVMVGDSLTDISTARAAGVPVIAVDFGYSERPVAEYGPDRIISQFAQLPTAIAAIFSAQ